MNLQSLKNDYRLFINIVVFASIVISFFSLYSSYNSFYNTSNKLIKNNSNKIYDDLGQSLSYIENISGMIGQRIISKPNIKKEYINKIFNNLSPKVQNDSLDIFTWTLFDFSNKNNQVIVDSKNGILIGARKVCRRGGGESGEFTGGVGRGSG